MPDQIGGEQSKGSEQEKFDQTHAPLSRRISLLCSVLAEFAKVAPNNCYFVENSLPTTRKSPNWVTL